MTGRWPLTRWHHRAIGGLLSVLLHLGVGATALHLPPPPPLVLDDAVPVPYHAMHLPVQLAMPVRPPPPPAPEPEPPKDSEVLDNPVVRRQPRSQPAARVATKQAAANPAVTRASANPASAPVSEAPSGAEPAEEPTFGATMESSTTSGGGMEVPEGNSGDPKAGGRKAGGNGHGKGGAAQPATVAEVSKLPTPLGRCAGKYSAAARAAGIEGTVVLDLVVDATGKTMDIAVVSGLGHGLDEAAVAALAKCRFAPGERNGDKVAVRIRAFKIRFFLDGDD